MEYLIFGSLMVLALGFFMSITFLALSHILIIVPILAFLPKVEWKKLSISNWGLLIFALLCPISIILTAHNEIGLHYYNIMKFKYYLIGALAATPMAWFFKTKATEKQIRAIFWSALITSSVASLSGMIGIFTGFNPLKGGAPTNDFRNGGMFGMLMSYAHNEAIWCLILLGLFLNYKKVERYIPKWLLYTAIFLNGAGFITTYTRGAYFAFIAGAPFFFFKEKKKQFIAAISITAIVSAIAVATIPDVRIAFSSRAHSDLLRVGQWKAAAKVFELHPVMGVGFRNFQPYSTIIKTQYGYPEPKWEGHAHNNFLEIAAGMGIVGLIPFVVWIFGWLIESYKRNDVIGKIAFPCIIGIIVGGLTQNTITDGINVFLFMLMYAITQIEVNTL